MDTFITFHLILIILGFCDGCSFSSNLDAVDGCNRGSVQLEWEMENITDIASIIWRKILPTQHDIMRYTPANTDVDSIYSGRIDFFMGCSLVLKHVNSQDQGTYSISVTFAQCGPLYDTAKLTIYNTVTKSMSCEFDDSGLNCVVPHNSISWSSTKIGLGSYNVCMSEGASECLSSDVARCILVTAETLFFNSSLAVEQTIDVQPIRKYNNDIGCNRIIHKHFSNMLIFDACSDYYPVALTFTSGAGIIASLLNFYFIWKTGPCNCWKILKRLTLCRICKGVSVFVIITLILIFIFFLITRKIYCQERDRIKIIIGLLILVIPLLCLGIILVCTENFFKTSGQDMELKPRQATRSSSDVEATFSERSNISKNDQTNELSVERYNNETKESKDVKHKTLDILPPIRGTDPREDGTTPTKVKKKKKKNKVDRD